MPLFGSAINTSRIPVVGLRPEVGSSTPADPVPGLLWFDTAASPNVLKYWSGSAWVRANGADLPAGSIDNTHISSGAGIAISKLEVDPRARSSHTGSQLAATISDFLAAVQAVRLDQMALPTSPLNLNNQRATNVGSPSAGSDAANKQYVDDRIVGISSVKDPARVVAQTNVNLAAPGAAIDGVTMAAGNRFLAPAQSTTAQNGLYVWNGAATPATRAPDADAVGEVLDGTLVAVSEGTDAGKQYMQTATPSGAPGAWSQVWTVYNTSGTSYLGGAGLVLSGNTFNVVAADGTILVNADSIELGLATVAKGGTGATTPSGARANLGAVGKYAANLGALSAGVWANVVHNLNSTDVEQPSIREVSSGEFIGLDTKVIDANTIAVRSDVAYSAGVLRVVVVG